MSCYRWDGQDLLLRVLVQPRASRDELAGAQGDDYKVRITASPVDGKANAHLVRLLAEVFGVARKDVHLMCGKSGRRKTCRIHDPIHLFPPIERG